MKFVDFLIFCLCKIMLVFGAGLLPISVYAGDKNIVLASPTVLEGSVQSKFIKLLYTDLFQRLDYNFVLAFYPSKRCVLMATTGAIDGLVERKESFNSIYPSLLKIGAPIATVNFAAYSIDPTIKVTDWDSLKDTTYKIEYRLGVQKCEEMLVLNVPAKNLSVIKSPDLAIKKLSINRTDIYIDLDNLVDNLLTNSDPQSKTIYKIGTFENITTHMFLHEKHRSLVPLVERELEAMKKEGLFEYYRQHVE